ncbi:hypothetical protein F4806DRAFT_504034 [Annulohypoxylon nitens]|nr:hypothetical protein F4806DRAFT_504034 [Annulohypoxylon nitens]
MTGDKWPTDRTQATAESSKNANQPKSMSSWRRVLSSITSIGGLTGSKTGSRKGKEREEVPPSPPPLFSKVADTLTVETTRVTFPRPVVFKNPRSPFLRSFPPESSGSSSSSSVSSPTETPAASEFKYKWVPQAVLSVTDVKDPEAQSRVQHVITRAELDDKKVTPQEAYDTLRMANGSVNEAYRLIKSGENFFSPGSDDPKVKEQLQDASVVPPDAPQKNMVTFDEDFIYLDPPDHSD